MTEVENQSHLLYITGFGPFAGHEEKNASWEAVRLLPTQCQVKNVQFRIKLAEIPVVYDDVNESVEMIWQEKPSLVIHCGVHGKAKNIILEKCAYNSNYCKPDWNGKYLVEEKILLRNGGKECDKLKTCFDVDKIANDLNIQSLDKTFVCSTDVGNYLCGYIYLNSLDKDCERTLFIHVPPINSPYTSEETSKSIMAVMEKCVEQLIDNGKI